MSNLVTVLFDKDTGNFKLGGSGGLSGPVLGSNFVLGFHHTQSIASNTWEITHNSNSDKIVSVLVFDYYNKSILPNEIEVINQNIVKITFGFPMSGTANLALFL